MTEILIPFDLAIIVAGSYVAHQVSRNRVVYVGLAVCVSISLLRALALYTKLQGIPIYFLSCLLVAIPMYIMINRGKSYIAYMFIMPFGTILLLLGGPLQIVLFFWQMVSEMNSEESAALLTLNV